MSLLPRSKAKKSLGQNFLTDPNYQKKIAQALAHQYQGQPIVEIGPGQGAITQHLLEFADKLVLIEKDHQLAEQLQEKFSDESRVSVFQGDFLKTSLSDLPLDDPALVVGNLPYNVSSQILIQLFQNQHLFESLFLMFQKEVAQRCLASFGSKNYGSLSIWSQVFAKPQKLFHLPPTAFRPQPKVTSTFVRFDLIQVDVEREIEFVQFCKVLFSQRRKKIGSVLRNHNMIHQGLPYLEKRAEQLSLKEFRELFVDFNKKL